MAEGGESIELLLAAVSSLDGGEVIDANEQLASVARESEIHPLLIVEREQSKNLVGFGCFKATLQNKDARSCKKLSNEGMLTLVS